MAPLNVPELTPVAWVTVLSSVKRSLDAQQANAPPCSKAMPALPYRRTEEAARARKDGARPSLHLVQPARLELPLLDPQVARELGIVAMDLFDETLGILAAQEDVDRLAERVLGDRLSSTTACTITEGTLPRSCRAA
jgi:hypothetical protein